MRIILPDSADAAQRKTVIGWVSAECGGCGMPVGKSKECSCGYDYSHELDKKKWYGLPIIVWNEEDVICDIGGDNFFRDRETLFDYCADNGLGEEDLLLVNTKKLRCYEVNPERLIPSCPEGKVELPGEILDIIDEVNEMIRRYDTGYCEKETGNELRRMVLADV